ncbi:uncharacterized protein UV8b_05819 [Ustilaginoidea virens]|uniref:Uncharacterized protein n=1 Tax=Ustilaginoidea virens TaxID=1159556 RepID=A0A8E5MJ93_USTVR|nr:uncharacterized protein UV8b_05819 [Ustilaginoidea virens]QUC21576.1 hypothetical protein UV8b_05819 [Ustilaginoidea virens]
MSDVSEEVRNAAKAVPAAMMVVYVANSVPVFPILITLCYHMPDTTVALADNTTYPAVYVLKRSMNMVWSLSVPLCTIFLEGGIVIRGLLCWLRGEESQAAVAK